MPINLIMALHNHNALVGEKRYSSIEKTTLEHSSRESVEQNLATIKRVRDACRRSDYNNLFDPNSFNHAHTILTTLKAEPPRIISEEMRFQSGRIAGILRSPYSLFFAPESSPEEEAIFEKTVVNPVVEALQNSGKEEILSLLEDIGERKAISSKDPRITAYEKLLNTLPQNVDTFFEPTIATLNAQLEEVLEKEDKVKEVATAEFSPASFTITDAEGSRPLVLDDDPAIARKTLKDALAGAGKEKSPAIVHCTLNADTVTQLEAGERPKAGYSQLLRDSLGEDEVMPFHKAKAARTLDGIISDGRAHSPEEILNALKDFYEIGKPPALGRSPLKGVLPHPASSPVVGDAGIRQMRCQRGVNISAMP